MSIMYKVCKRTIERGNYPEDMITKINAFYSASLISNDQYIELINMLS